MLRYFKLRYDTPGSLTSKSGTLEYKYTERPDSYHDDLSRIDSSCSPHTPLVAPERHAPSTPPRPQSSSFASGKRPRRPSESKDLDQA